MPDAGAPTLRAFFALDLDARSVRRVARVADRLRMGSGAPSAAWTPPHNLHLTLKFLGDVDRAHVGPLAAEVGPLASGRKAPLPGAFRLDAFPSAGRAEVVVALLDDPDGEVAELATRVDAIALRHGVGPEKRAFRPHVTLARLKRPFDVRRWLRPELAPGSDACGVSSLTLFETRLDPRGAVYEALATFPYQG